MKKFVLLIIFVLSGFSFAQTSNDIVVENNINIKFLNSLVLSICNDSTQILKGFVKRSHLVTYRCAEYQSSYLSTYEPPKILFHENQKPYRGVYLKTINERKNHFNTKGQLAHQTGEICSFVVITYGVTTYGDLANHIIGNFLKSEPHRNTIMIDYPYGDFSCTQGVYNGQKGVYVTGVFSR